MDWFWIFVAWLVRTVFWAAVPAVALALAGRLIWRRSPRLRRPLAATSVVVAVGWMVACAILGQWPPGPPVRVLSATVLRQDFLWAISPLGLAATVLAPFAVRSARGGTVVLASTTGDRPLWRALMPVGFLVVTAAAYVVYVWPPFPYPWLYGEGWTRFDADRWQTLAGEEYPGRMPMLRSLLRDERIPGKTRGVLTSRLGPPEAYHLAETRLRLSADIWPEGPPQADSAIGIGYLVGEGWECWYELVFYFGRDNEVRAYELQSLSW